MPKRPPRPRRELLERELADVEQFWRRKLESITAEDRAHLDRNASIDVGSAVPSPSPSLSNPPSDDVAATYTWATAVLESVEVVKAGGAGALDAAYELGRLVSEAKRQLGSWKRITKGGGRIKQEKDWSEKGLSELQKTRAASAALLKSALQEQRAKHPQWSDLKIARALHQSGALVTAHESSKAKDPVDALRKRIARLDDSRP